MREQINQKQRENVFAAYRNCDVDRDYLDTIYETGASQKVSLSELFGTDTLVFERPLSAVELNELQLLSDTADRFPDYSFSWGNKSVTERSTGHCMPLKKFSEKNGLSITELNDLCEKKITLVLSCNPWFLIGSSVVAHGYQLDSSCHYPDGSYASGAISYALDKHTAVVCRWDGEGLTGRMLIHIDTDAPGIVTGRHYGDFTGADASFIRKQIYALFNGFKTSDWKKNGSVHSKHQRFLRLLR